MKKSLVLIALLVIASVGAYLALRFNRSRIITHANNVLLYDRGKLRFSLVKDLSVDLPTSLQVGVDGRLYVAEEKGLIKAITLERGAGNSIRAVGQERIDVITAIPNHHDDGILEPEVEGRLITGLFATGTTEAPAFFVSSSDPRVYGTDVDTNSGVISLIRKEGDVWVRQNLVCGLPRSRTDHATNGLYFDQEKQLLYVMQGGNTNAGGPSERSGDLPEYALSGALLQIDLARLPASGCFDLPTLDDPARPGTADENDPYGGAAGMNQAILDPASPVSIYAAGFRNAYRVVPFRDGFLAIDNGANQYYGGKPAMRGDQVTNDPSPEDGERLDGPLLRIEEGAYYGHPNPTRADQRNTFAGQSPIAEDSPEEAFFVNPRQRQGALALFTKSVNGLAWYPDDAGFEEWRGKLVVAGWDRRIRLLDFDESGWIADSDLLLEQGPATSLDVAVSSAGGPLEGVIWICDYTSGNIAAIDPIVGEWDLSDSLSLFKRRALHLMRDGVFAYYGASAPSQTMEVLIPADAP